MYLASFIIIHYIILKCKPEDRINLVYKILFKNVDLKTILGNLLKKCLKNFIKVYQLQIRHLSHIFLVLLCKLWQIVQMINL